ncbi:uncharacterized protein LOC119370090 [Jatropha curcas]|uniref:uncharacterized protein LOC119370090 n=1 Tax=Jatropha curcas TaxID=180498 RepID=UPI00189593FF|nr:uncharacterized protein LOC119370090 [Jatropha curcas]
MAKPLQTLLSAPTNSGRRDGQFSFIPSRRNCFIPSRRICQLWYMQLLDDIPNPSWAEFFSPNVNLRFWGNLRFGPPIRSNKLGELAKLKQTRSIADYQNQFETLVSRAGTLTQHQKVQLYLSDLQDSIAVEVELHHPTDLVNAMSISQLYECKLFPRSSAARDTSRAAIPPDNRANRTVRRLSHDEMEERQKKGLCFNCDEQFVRGHQCKKLFWIDLEETEDVEDFTADPKISLNAITRIRNPQSMRLIGSWMLGQVLILIDFGSTHSFVSAAKVEELNAVVNKQNGLKDTLPMASNLLAQGHLVKLQGITSSSSSHGSNLNNRQISSVPDIQLQKLLAKFASLFNAPTGLPPSRSCDHRIPLIPGAGPVVVQPYRYPHGQKDDLMVRRTRLKSNALQCYSRESSVPAVPHSRRRELNTKTIKDKFPIPVIDELLEELGGAKFFSKLDLLSGCFQVGMHPADIEKTAFRTHHGHFEFLVMPFGLSNSPSTFQALMNENQLVLKRSKCVFGQSQISYLGHIISSQGVQVDQSKIATKLKAALTSTPILILPNFDLTFVIECDASSTGIGAVLLQHNQPVTYFSRSLAAHHQNLSAYERELIGLVKAIKHWHSYLWGREFIVRTNHYTLKYLLEQHHLSATQQHWISKLLGFFFTVEYRTGKSNLVADALSRRNADDSILMAVSMPQLSLFDEIRKEHSDSPAIQQQISTITNGAVASNGFFGMGYSSIITEFTCLPIPHQFSWSLVLFTTKVMKVTRRHYTESLEISISKG